jgi:hypothetical protein
MLAAVLGETGARIASTSDFPDISDVARLGVMSEPGRPPVPYYGRGADAKPQVDKVLTQR